MTLSVNTLESYTLKIKMLLKWEMEITEKAVRKETTK